MSFVRVALDVPVNALFDYRAPGVTKQDIGRRVSVPFGNRQTVGVILGIAEQPSIASNRIKQITQLCDDAPSLPGDILSLLHFCSDYYHHPIGEIVLRALPKRLRQTTPLKQQRVYRYSLANGIEVGALPARAAAKNRLLVLLRERGSLSSAEVTSLSVATKKALKEFIALGWVEQTPIDSPGAETKQKPGPNSKPLLTDDQLAAVNAIKNALNKFGVWLLRGVTGSGKTEVYLHLLEEILNRGGQTLILVPEINLSPQLEAVFYDRFPHIPLVSLHSGLNESERLNNWLRACSGDAKIVLGTRLAIFTPLPKLQLILVDEEHDASFKQQEGLRYSARDVAIFRAKQHDIPVVLGSATPSLESYAQALSGRYHLLALNNRINSLLPTIEYINTRNEKLQHGLSQQLIAEIATSLKRGEQILVFINRRGYAPALLCRACNWAAPCDRCSAKLVLHRRDQRLRCHHCGHQETIPVSCPSCGNQELIMLGQGTQRIEETLEALFPQARVLRVDRDTTRRKSAWQGMRKEIQENKAQILVGTQILAKGHDFPNLNLVGVLNADDSLYSVDFRAEEKLFAQLVQVAGRAGRGSVRGRVLIQTEFPQHPLYRSLQSHDYASFAESALLDRRRAKFPPYVYQAILRAESTQLETVMHYLKQAVKLGAALNLPVTIYDPVEAALRRVAGHERAQILVQSTSRKILQEFLTGWYQKLSATRTQKLRWALDVDPLEF